MQKKVKGRIWLLSKTSEGPILAERLLQQGWSLDVSVASTIAAKSYPLSSQIEIKIELAKGFKSPLLTLSVLKARLKEKRFNWIIDATHPFKLNNVDYLTQACKHLHQPLLRLERSREIHPKIQSIDSLDALQALTNNCDRILLVTGIQDLAYISNNCHASCFALISPDPFSLQLALSMGFPPENLACLLPSCYKNNHSLEYALCKHWRISAIVLCQSGCPTEKLWSNIGEQVGIRPILVQNITHLNKRYGFSAKELLEILK